MSPSRWLSLAAAIVLAIAAFVIIRASSDTAHELARNHTRWGAAGVADYTWTVKAWCFCPADEVTASVRGGIAVDVRAHGRVVAPDSEQLRVLPVTVEDFFGKLDALLAEDPDILNIEYDAELGYPTSVRVDYEKDAIDEELLTR
jgi:uncharacterized protein DUF6174